MCVRDSVSLLIRHPKQLKFYEGVAFPITTTVFAPGDESITDVELDPTNRC